MPAKKPPTVRLSTMVPEGTELILNDRAADASRAENKVVSPGELHARLLVLALETLKRCPACSAKLPCDNHGPSAYAAAIKTLGLAQPPPPAKDSADPLGEHQRLIDLYHKLFEKARKEPPAYCKGDFAAFKRLRAELGFARARDAIEGAFADPFDARRMSIQKIAKDPSAFLGKRDALAAAPRGSLQGGGQPWGST